jgi:hypothetical protein
MSPDQLDAESVTTVDQPDPVAFVTPADDLPTDDHAEPADAGLEHEGEGGA